MNFLCLSVDFTVTLMRLIEDGYYIESGDKIFRYFFRVSSDWQNDYQAKAFVVAQKMYGDLAEQFRIAEPTDPNYIAVKSTLAAILTAAEIVNQPWNHAEPPVWEQTPCVIVNEENDYRKVDTQLFGAFFV